jgi:hypothetical protein
MRACCPGDCAGTGDEGDASALGPATSSGGDFPQALHPAAPSAAVKTAQDRGRSFIVGLV